MGHEAACAPLAQMAGTAAVLAPLHVCASWKLTAGGCPSQACVSLAGFVLPVAVAGAPSMAEAVQSIDAVLGMPLLLRAVRSQSMAMVRDRVALPCCLGCLFWCLMHCTARGKRLTGRGTAEYAYML